MKPKPACEPPKNKAYTSLPAKVHSSVARSQQKYEVGDARRSNASLYSNSFGVFERKHSHTRSHDVLAEFTLIVQQRQRCLNFAAEVSDLGDVVVMKSVQQLIGMNQLDRQDKRYELELLDSFTQQIQHERQRRILAKRQELMTMVLIGVLKPLAIIKTSEALPVISTLQCC